MYLILKIVTSQFVITVTLVIPVTLSGWPTHENKTIPANLLKYYLFFQPNQHEKQIFFKPDHKKS